MDQADLELIVVCIVLAILGVLLDAVMAYSFLPKIGYFG